MTNLSATTTHARPRLQARIAGSLYVISIVTGIFAEIFVREKLTVHGDAAATAANILANQTRFRLGFAGELFACACNIPLGVIFYNLFKIVNKNLAMAIVLFTMVGTAIEGVFLLDHLSPLIMLRGSSYLNAFTPAQLQAQAYMALQLQSIGFSIALVFFGFYCITAGYLIFKSTFLPRAIGILLAIQGVGYLVNSFTLFIAPELQSRIFPYFMVTGVGEIFFCLWLLIAGVNVKRWHERAGHPAN